MKAVESQRPEKTLRAMRSDETLREIRHLLVDGMDRETEGGTRQMDGLSFILGFVTCAMVLYMVFAIGQTIGVW